MQIKIYRFSDNRSRKMAEGEVDLSYPPKVTQCRAVTGSDAGTVNEVRGYIEVILKNDLIPGGRGLEDALEHYKPPVREPFVQINGVDYAWTIEGAPFEAARKEIENIPKGKPNTEAGERFQRSPHERKTLQDGFRRENERPVSVSHRPKTESTPQDGVSEKKKKILIVEDNPDLSKALKIRLQESGYEVITAFDALQGVSLAHKQRPDLIILDILMPAGWGFTVAQKLKHSGSAWLRSIPIIFVTGSQDERHEKMAMRLGARFYFHKPLSYEPFLEAVKSTLEEKT